MYRLSVSAVRRSLSGVLALLLVFAAVPLLSATAGAATVNKTLAEALAWMDSKLGSRQDYDGSGSVQCVDLARMYSTFLGADLGVVNPSNPRIGVAADYIWQPIPAAYTRLTNSQTTAQPGDIFVWGKGQYGASSKTGHVGLVHHVSGNSYYIIDYGSNRGAPGSYTQVVGLNSFSVVLRPNFKNAAFHLDVNGRLDGNLSGSLFDYGTFSITVNGVSHTGINDFFDAGLQGSVSYTISNIQATPCHKYQGVESGSLSATISGNTDVVLVFTTAHTPVNVPAVPATCTASGVSAGVKCGVCGTVLSGFETVPALGHAYLRTRKPATCTQDAVDVYTCLRCKNQYTKPAESAPAYGNWTETRPTPGKNQTVETKTQYRYADKTPIWTKTASGTIDYAAGWPSGFLTSSPLYGQYNVSPKTAGETATAKTEVTTSTVGWIYWHWCRNSYAYGPINRTISDHQDATHVGFHAFFSATDAAVTQSANARRLDNAAVCKDTYWWLVNRVEIRRCTYTEYVKTPGDGWGDWSRWSDEKASASDTRKVETRTLYRLKTEEPVKALGHDWDKGSVTVAPTCFATGLRTFTCTRCAETRKESVPMTSHNWDAGTVTLPATAATDGVVVFTCLTPGCGKTRSEKIPAGSRTPGDVDLDGKVTASDARLALRRAVSLNDRLTGIQILNADVDGKTGVTAADARLILRAAVGLEDPKTWK